MSAVRVLAFAQVMRFCWMIGYVSMNIDVPVAVFVWKFARLAPYSFNKTIYSKTKELVL